MGAARSTILDRLREIRRRHFGPRGASAFAQRLGVDPLEYARYERGVMPSGEVLLRACEATGEDLQWLLTGVAGRGTMVITGTRARHQEVLGRVARLLEVRPELAQPIESFVALLDEGAAADRDRSDRAACLQLPSEELVPLFSIDDAPSDWQKPSKLRQPLALPDRGVLLSRQPLVVHEITGEPSAAHAWPAQLVATDAAGGGGARFIHAAGIAPLFPRMIALELDDDEMAPLLRRGDAALLAADALPVLGLPAAYRRTNASRVQCRVWLGEDDACVHLGRVRDHGREAIPRKELQWTARVLFRASRVA